MRRLPIIALAAILSGCVSHPGQKALPATTAEETTWDMGHRLVETARRYAKEHAVKFQFEGAGTIVVIVPVEDRAAADVWFYSAADKPKLRVAIGADGTVIGHGIITPAEK